jgi:hypothetical protein
MTDTDIPAHKAPRNRRPDSCLHCVLMTAIEEWSERHGERRDSKVVLDVAHIISKLTECIAEVINAPNLERSQRRRALRMAHEALDANMRSIKTGKLVELEIPAEH